MTNETGQRTTRGVKRHGSRYKARRRAVDLLFEGEARDVDPVELAHERCAMSVDPDNQVAPVNPYTVTIVDGVAVHLDFLDEAIERFLTEEWELYRIPAVDRAILRLSMWELVFNPEVPTKTAVVEGTELASQYSGDKAASYINAMLDRVAGSVEELRATVQQDAAAVGEPFPEVESSEQGGAAPDIEAALAVATAAEEASVAGAEPLDSNSSPAVSDSD